MSKKISSGLMEKQETARRQTVNTVLRAISELKAEGYSIKIKDLMERTGLSRSVFAKPHIRAVLIEQSIIASKPCNSESGHKPQKPSREQRLKLIIAEKDLRIRGLTEENATLKGECELLRGRLFLLMQRHSLE